MFRNLYSYPIFIGTFNGVQIFLFWLLKMCFHPHLFLGLSYCQRDCTKHADKIFKKQCVQIVTGPVSFGTDPDKGEQICTSIKICNVRLTVRP